MCVCVCARVCECVCVCLVVNVCIIRPNIEYSGLFSPKVNLF